jgi:AcrR family transcriptional regulator
VAAAACLAVDPSAPLTTIAAAAGVSRVTLYSHFASRQELLDATVRSVVGKVDDLLQREPFESLSPLEALERMIRLSWQVVAEYQTFVVSVSRQHGDLVERYDHVVNDQVRTLLERARRAGSVRTDQPIEWQVAVYHDLMVTGARLAVNEGLSSEVITDLLIQTLLTAYTDHAGWTSGNGLS